MARVAIITEASRGIGAATALVLAKRGYRVVVNHRASAPRAEEVVAAIAAAGGEAVAIKADVTVPNDVTAMVDEIDQRWGGTDVLVHNALIPFAITSFAELTRRQAGPRAACRIPDDESRRAGDDFPRLRAADLPQHGLVPPATRRNDHPGHRQGGNVNTPPPKSAGFKLRLKAGLVGPLGRLGNSCSIPASPGGPMRCVLAAEHDLRLASSRDKAS